MPQRILLAVLISCATLLGGCSKAYYKTWEKLGYEKRDILVSRVEDARDEQEAAKEQFQTTLERFQELSGQSGGELSSTYNKLKKDYDRSASRASAVRERIASVETVAGDLFTEWRGEIDQISSPDLKSRSNQLLVDTRERYGQLIDKMKASSEKMEPVLTAFNDQVLFLKANLNAQAVSSLESTALEIEEEVQALIADMNASIAEANDFIDSMGN